jgi:hypothetical protein
MQDREITTFDHAQVLRGLPGGFHFPTRMTAVPLAGDEVALISPVPIDDARAERVAELGRVSHLLAPNLLHSLYLGAASQRYPGARVLAPPGLAAKHPALRVDATLDQGLSGPLRAALELIRLEGAPSMDEYVFFHRRSGTLIVTDLVFNVVRPRGFWAHLMLTLTGCHGRLASSRTWRFLVKDRAAMERSIERLLALPLRSVVMAHGDIVRDDARERLANALRHWLPARAALPARS